MKSKKTWLLGLAILGLAIFAVLFHPWRNLTMVSHLSLTDDEQGKVISRRFKVAIHQTQNPRPLEVREIDLSSLAGKLVKLELSGKMNQRWSRRPVAGYIGYNVALSTPQGMLPLEFIGWSNPSARDTQPGPFGSSALQISLGEDKFFMNADRPIWYVLAVPEQAKLLVKIVPLPFASLPAKPKEALPTAPKSLPPLLSHAAQNYSRPPDIFIYLIDALRADHLGCYGYERPTSPAIDAFAKEATLFEEAQTPVTWTRPAVASLLTGLYPSAHEVAHKETGKLLDWHISLPKVLRPAGYRTSAIVGNANIGTPEFGFTQGFDRFEYLNNASPQWVNQKAADFLKNVDSRQPVFMYLHLMEPHMSYNPTPESLKLFDRHLPGRYTGTYKEFSTYRPKLTEADIGRLIDRYDGEIRDNDLGFEEFLALLRQQGRFNNAVIILVADHGESFLEHGVIQHGWSLNKSEMHVPLIIRFPGGQFAGERIRERVSLVDVFPTLAGQVKDFKLPDYPLPGEDLFLIAKENPARPTRSVFSETSMYPDNKVYLIGIIDSEGYKRVIDVSRIPGKETAPQSIGLWDTLDDPDEKTNLIEKYQIRAAYDEQMLSRWIFTQQLWQKDSRPAPKQFEVPEARLKELRALGYVK